MRYISILLVTLIANWSCDSANDDISQNDLDSQLNEIRAMVENETCTDSSEWLFVGLGAKPCGGPTDYIAYSTNMDVGTFLELVERYNQDVRAFNEENGLISDCAIEPAPSAIVCEDGRAVLVY